MHSDLLSELIGRKRACLLGLRELGERQLGLVREGAMTALLDLLGAKQRMIVELQGIERGLAPFRRDDPESRAWRTPDDRLRCAEQLAECEALLVEIMRKEKQSESELTRRRDEAAQRLDQALTAADARGAYSSEALVPAASVDYSA